MDMLGDTCQALDAYLSLCTHGANKATSYLIVFGALQVLYVQQDAAYWLCRSLGYARDVAAFGGPDKWIHSPGYERLSEVRNLRNSSIGHPVNREKGLAKDRGSYFIVQMSLGARGFQMMARGETGSTRWISVPVLELVIAQTTSLASVFRSTLREVDDADRAHRETFRGECLEAMFLALSHPLEKMHQAVSEHSFRPVGIYGVESVQRTMAEFRRALEQRNEPFGDDLEYRFGRLNGALSRLTDFYQGRADDVELADILATFVTDRIDELRTWAREVDDEYAG
jgi:hypothetical protein